MRDSWLELVDSVLRPTRPHLDACFRDREHHLAARRRFAEERLRAIAKCQSRIEGARAAVFAADDGIIPSLMTDLEREWRLLSRSDPDQGLMDLWARIAPASWIDRKRWRDNPGDTRLDAAIALAADVEGVEAAEAATSSLRAALAPWGVRIGSRIQWRSFECDSDCTTELLAQPLRAACEAISAGDAASVILARARDLEKDVAEASAARFPERPLLVRSLAHAAFFDFVWRARARTHALRRAASLAELPNPVTSLCELWKTGYAVSAFDASTVTLEIPPL